MCYSKTLCKETGTHWIAYMITEVLIYCYVFTHWITPFTVTWFWLVIPYMVMQLSMVILTLGVRENLIIMLTSIHVSVM